jgi:hypothetical protein
MGFLTAKNSKIFDFSQFGPTNGPKFLEPVRGVLPIGRNGFFNTLQSSPLSDQRKLSGILSYNYTLENQGFSTNVSCEYDERSPVVTLFPLTAGVGGSQYFGTTYTGNCTPSGLINVVSNLYTATYSTNSLSFWTCKSPPSSSQASSYYIYLRGLGIYGAQIGNITCTIPPIQSAIYEVMYQSNPDLFSSTEPIQLDATTYTHFIDQYVQAFGQIIANAQNQKANQIAELVGSLGVISFKLSLSERNSTYLRLYEAMIQGMMQYTVRLH